MAQDSSSDGDDPLSSSILAAVNCHCLTVSLLLSVIHFYFGSFFFARGDLDLTLGDNDVFGSVVFDDAIVSESVDVILDTEVVLVEEPDAIASDCDTAACISSLNFFLCQCPIENSRFRLGIGGP